MRSKSHDAKVRQMHLSAREAACIRDAVQATFGATAEVRLFGSRVDDAKRGERLGGHADGPDTGLNNPAHVLNERVVRGNAMNILQTMALLCGALFAATAVTAATPDEDYQVNPGDVLQVVVWKEPDLSVEAVVRPDGKFSFPLVGDVQAKGKSVLQITEDIKARVDTYVPDAVVTVLVNQATGNTAYVVGKVSRPGPIPMIHKLDVLQALSLAGGTIQFAKVKDILIVRREEGGQKAIPFNYDDILDGEGLEQNIQLLPGDVVVVP